MPQETRKFAPEIKEMPVELETKNAKYRLIYGVHDKKHDPAVFEGTDIIFIEQPAPGKESGQKDTEYARKVAVMLAFIHTSPDTQSAATYAKEHKLPLLFVDAVADALRSKVNLQKTIGTTEAIISGAVAGWTVADILRKFARRQKIKRRNFLSLLAAGYLGTKIPNTLAREASGNNPDYFKTQFHRISIAVNERIHPEANSIILTLRNLVMADNAEVVNEVLSSVTKRKVNAAFVLGGAHVGIEDDLIMSPSERLEAIKKFKPSNINEFGNMLAIQWENQDGKTVWDYSSLQNPNLRVR